MMIYGNEGAFHSPQSYACSCCVLGPMRMRRRQFLARSGRGLLAALAAGTLPAIQPARAQTMLAPDAALAQLMAGNARFVAKKMTAFDEDLTILKQNTVAKQEPFAAVLSCADSRVPVELIFDQSIGHVFVTRVAGNICTPEIIASLEYGAAVLGTAVIMVLGHQGCGAVKAAIGAKPVPGQISALYAPIRPAVERAGNDLTAAIQANATIQADLLRTASPVLAGLVGQGKLKVVAGYYSLESGQVSLLG
jgi:carbonic anhydrase